VPCNVNYCLIEIEGLLKVTDSHVHSKCGNVSEMVHVKRRCYQRPLIGSDIRTVEQQVIPMTLNDLRRHSPFQIGFLYSYAAIDKISTHTARRAVPL